MASKFKFYLSSHNTIHGYAGKHGYMTLAEAVDAFHSVRKCKLKNLYYVVEKPNETVLLDSRDLN